MGYSKETQGVLDGTKLPASNADGRLLGGRVRSYQATLDLADTAVDRTNGDTNVLFKLPKGEKPILGAIVSSATMGGTATIAIGTAAAPAKYRAAAIHTTANAPQLFMLSSALDDAPLTEEEEVIMTIAAADLPSSGILQIVMLTSGQ